MMDSYTSGTASQNNPFVPYVAFDDGVIPQQQKVAETLTQEVTFLLFPSRRLCFGETPPCFLPKVSSLPLSFPMISFIPCGFLISPASSGLSSDRYGLIARSPLASSFQSPQDPASPCLSHSTRQLAYRSPSVQFARPISSSLSQVF